MGKKRLRPGMFASGMMGGADYGITKEQWDELMIASIRKLNEDEVRAVKLKICQQMNILAHKELNLELSVPITEAALLKELTRAVEEGILMRLKNGAIMSYGIAGEKTSKIDLTVEDPLEDGRVLQSLVRSLLIARKNEGKGKGFVLEEIIPLFEEANDINYPEGEDKAIVLDRVVVGALRKGCTSGHVRKLGKEYYMTGRSPGVATKSIDPFSKHV